MVRYINYLFLKGDISFISGQFPQPHAEYSTDTVIYKGGPPMGNGRGPLPTVSFFNLIHFSKTNIFSD